MLLVEVKECVGPAEEDDPLVLSLELDVVQRLASEKTSSLANCEA